MSFAGHVLDMIRRDKEDRALRQQARENSKEARKRYIGGNDSYEDSPVTLEEFERINRELKERDKQEKRYYFRVLLLFTIFAFIGIGILWFLL